MTKEELLSRINDIEWDDFEIKAAQDKLPKDVWETVSAFSNTSGGWIVFGVRQCGKLFDIIGCNNAEKTESDFLFCQKVGICNSKGNLTFGGMLMFGGRDVVQIHSMPRNPNFIKFFRYAKLGENAGYGIDKMLTWEKLTGNIVDFQSDLVYSTVTYWLSGQASGQTGLQINEQIQKLINILKNNVLSVSDIQRQSNITSRRYVRERMITPAIEQGYVLRTYPDKPNHPQQRYYLSKKGLKLITN